MVDVLRGSAAGLPPSQVPLASPSGSLVECNISAPASRGQGNPNYSSDFDATRSARPPSNLLKYCSRL